MSTAAYEHPAFARARSLPAPWCDHFPKSVEEAQKFQPFALRQALATHVLCVAITRIECSWAAYCDAVTGDDHEHEQYYVLETGDKLPEPVARALFPMFDGVPYAR